MIGDSQIGNGAPVAWIAPIQTSANNVCRPWRRVASPQLVAASPRGGDFHSSFHPVSAATKNWVWNSIRTGASSSEWKNSMNALPIRRLAPP